MRGQLSQGTVKVAFEPTDAPLLPLVHPWTRRSLTTALADKGTAHRATGLYVEGDPLHLAHFKLERLSVGGGADLLIHQPDKLDGTRADRFRQSAIVGLRDYPLIIWPSQARLDFIVDDDTYDVPLIATLVCEPMPTTNPSTRWRGE